MIRDYIPSFQMISKENLKIWIDQRLNWGINIVIISACIWCILNPIVLDKGKVLNDLDVFNLPIFTHQLCNCIIVDVIKTTDKELSNKNHLVNFLRGSSLHGQLCLLSFWHSHVCFLQFFVEMQVIISQAKPYFLFKLLLFFLFISWITLTKLKNNKPWLASFFTVAPFIFIIAVTRWLAVMWIMRLLFILSMLSWSLSVSWIWSGSWTAMITLLFVTGRTISTVATLLFFSLSIWMHHSEMKSCSYNFTYINYLFIKQAFYIFYILSGFDHKLKANCLNKIYIFSGNIKLQNKII